MKGEDYNEKENATMVDDAYALFQSIGQKG